MPLRKNITGQRFGKLLVIKEVGFIENKGGSRSFSVLCLCDCGNEKAVRQCNLLGGTTISCGCDWNTTHGHTKGAKPTGTWRTWYSMIERCVSKNASNYHLYGGRGITVCERWRDSFENFLADMGPRPIGTTIDRINVNGNYEPGNCRWATQSQQGRNTRFNHKLTFDGKTMCLMEWSEVIGFNYNTLLSRIKRGWKAEDVLTAPLGSNRLQRCKEGTTRG